MRWSFRLWRLIWGLTIALPFVWLVSAQNSLQVGYTVLAADPGNSVPAAAALFSYSNAQDVLVSQAAAGAVVPMRTLSTFVDEEGARTGIALVNSSSRQATMALRLRGPSGAELMRRNVALAAGQHMAGYVSELFSGLPATFTGSLTVESDQPLAAVTLRESRNAFGESIYSTLPVVDLDRPASNDAVVFPHIAIGDGYTTEVILINGTGNRSRGKVHLFSSDGRPMLARSNGSALSELTYQIEAYGTYRAHLESISGLYVGFGVIVPEAGSAVPGGTAIFRYNKNSAPVSDAAVAAASPTKAARIYVDSVGTRTGLAISNPGSQPADLTITLFNRNGLSESVTTRRLPAGNHFSAFTDELFPRISGLLTGIMEIRSSVPIVPVTLKMTVNQRQDLILTTLPVADLDRPPSAPSVIVPHIAMGSGFSTRLVLINTSAQSSAAGSLSFYFSDGSPLPLPFGAEVGSRFAFRMDAGTGRQYYPGSPLRVAGLVIRDPSTRAPAHEIAVNEGNTVRAWVDVIDTTGAPRHDVAISYGSLDPDIASVDELGNIRGNTAGFATVTARAGSAVANVTIAVVAVDSGVSGFQVSGIAQDLSRRLYLASSADHTVLLAQDLRQAPVIYAGVRQNPGLRNSARLQSLFRNPAFLAFNQAEGSVYVSDTSNNVIRRLRPGIDGQVETAAGTGTSGSIDGEASQAAFSAPQGVALDDRGRLWVVDSGNHTIRRINLGTGSVETIAGKPGNPGFTDGVRDAARFRSPLGIAIVPESALEELDRQRRGLPPPPARAIVADAGNGVLRLVTEAGEVSTINSTAGTSSISKSQLPWQRGLIANAAAVPASFNSPAGVAVDDSGNIYVTEPNSRSVRAILRNGAIVSAAQANSFVSPRGIAITENGRVLIADGSPGALRYGEPQINVVTPSILSNKGGQTVTIRGRNFTQDAIVVIDGVIADGVNVEDTRTIKFTTPQLSSAGLGTLTVQNRGGLAQHSVTIQPAALNTLPPGYITTIAGGSTYSGDGTRAGSALTDYIRAMVIDSAGNIFFTEGNRVRRISAATGIITTIAGESNGSFSGDNGPGIAATLNNPNGLALDGIGNLFVADTDNSRIRKINLATGVISTFAGKGTFRFGGDNGPALEADFGNPQGVAIDGAGNLFVTDTFNQRIRRIDGRTRIITTIAGSGPAGFLAGGFSGDDGPATEALLSNPTGIALDSLGNIYFSDNINNRIRRINTRTGIITTEAQNLAGIYGTLGFLGIAVDAANDVYLTDFGANRVRKLNPRTGAIVIVAGNGSFAASGSQSIGDGGPATAATVTFPKAVATDAAGNIYIMEEVDLSIFNNRIRKVFSTTGIITTLAGGPVFSRFSGDGGPAIASRFRIPGGMAIDPRDNIYVSDVADYRIRRINQPDLTIETVAGNGTRSLVPGGLPPLVNATRIAVDNTGNVYFTTTLPEHGGAILVPNGALVSKIDTRTGAVTTVAGTGVAGFSGDGEPATLARLDMPVGLAVDTGGNLFIADYGNRRIRKVAADTGIITTVAGNGVEDFSGDGGPATQAGLSPYAIAVDTSGNLFVVNRRLATAPAFEEPPDRVRRIRRIDATTGIITTIAGTGSQAIFGDRVPALEASLRSPEAIAVDSAGNVFITDFVTGRIRAISAKTGLIFTVAGGGSFSGGGPFPTVKSDVPATEVFMSPIAIAVDSDDNLYITDFYSKTLRGIRRPVP